MLRRCGHRRRQPRLLHRVSTPTPGAPGRLPGVQWITFATSIETSGSLTPDRAVRARDLRSNVLRNAVLLRVDQTLGSALRPRLRASLGQVVQPSLQPLSGCRHRAWRERRRRETWRCGRRFPSDVRSLCWRHRLPSQQGLRARGASAARGPHRGRRVPYQQTMLAAGQAKPDVR